MTCNVSNWVAMVPDVFVGSAITDVSVLVFNAVRDLQEGRWEDGTHHNIGSERLS